MDWMNWIEAFKNEFVPIFFSREAIVVYVAIAGLGVNIITYKFREKQLKQNQLTETIKILNHPLHREARKVIYNQEKISNISFQLLEIEKSHFTEYEAESKDVIIEISKNIVRSDLNHAGTLIHHKMMDSDVFLDEYWWIILKSWQVLKSDIEKRRNSKNGVSNYMRNFEELKNKAEDFAKKNYPNDWENFVKMVKI
jgi:hypothetical protein